MFAGGILLSSVVSLDHDEEQASGKAKAPTSVRHALVAIGGPALIAFA